MVPPITPTPVPPEWVELILRAMQESSSTAETYNTNLAGALVLMVIVVIVCLTLGLFFISRITGSGRRGNRPPDAETEEAQAERITAATFNQAFLTMNKSLEQAGLREDRAIKQAQDERQQFLSQQAISNDIQKRIGETLEEFKKQQMNRDVLLAALQTDLKRVADDTPLMPHLIDIKETLENIKKTLDDLTVNLSDLTKKATDLRPVCDRLDTLQALLEMDMQEWVAKLDAAKRIAEAVQDVPVTEDIPAPLDGNETQP